MLHVPVALLPDDATPASANQQGTTRSHSDSIMHNRVIRTRDWF